MSDEEGEFVTPYLSLLRGDATQRVRALHDVFDAVYWMVGNQLSVADAARGLCVLANGRAAGQPMDGGRLL